MSCSASPRWSWTASTARTPIPGCRAAATAGGRAFVPALGWGVAGRWQSGVWNTESSGFRVRQDAYEVVDAFVSWELRPNATLRLNVRNLGDRKYINTLRYSGYYGAPANYTLSFDWRFQ